MKKLTMWGLVAVMAVIGFASSPAQAKEPSVKHLDGKTAYEHGRRGGSYYRGGRGGRYYGPRRGYWGGSYYYSRGPRYYGPRYYAPAPVVIAPAPTVVYGGSCY